MLDRPVFLEPIVNRFNLTMKTAATLALLAGTAAAFAPQQQTRASTSLAAFEDALGVQKPLGFWYVGNPILYCS